MLCDFFIFSDVRTGPTPCLLHCSSFELLRNQQSRLEEQEAKLADLAVTYINVFLQQERLLSNSDHCYRVVIALIMSCCNIVSYHYILPSLLFINLSSFQINDYLLRVN